MTNPATGPATDVVDAFDSAAQPFTRVVDQVDSWDADSPCEGWSAAQLLDHVIETERDFLTTHGAAMPEPDEQATPADRWAGHLAATRQALAVPGFAETRFDGHFGPATVGETLLSFYGFDLIVHRVDLAGSQGREEAWTEDEMDRLEQSIAAFGPALYSPGVCADPVAVLEDADRQTRILGLLGRGA